MAEDAKPVGTETPIRTVPLTELIKERKTLNEKIKRSEEQRQDALRELEGIKAELEIARSQMDSDDVADVKKALIKQDKELQAKVDQFSKREASLTEREKRLRVRELVSEYASKGITLDEEELMVAEDPRDIVLEKVATALNPAKIGTPKSETPKPEEKVASGIYESIPASTPPNKAIWEMTDAEFKKFEKDGLAKTLAKK